MGHDSEGYFWHQMGQDGAFGRKWLKLCYLVATLQFHKLFSFLFVCAVSAALFKPEEAQFEYVFKSFPRTNPKLIMLIEKIHICITLSAPQWKQGYEILPVA